MVLPLAHPVHQTPPASFRTPGQSSRVEGTSGAVSAFAGLEVLAVHPVHAIEADRVDLLLAVLVEDLVVAGARTILAGIGARRSAADPQDVGLAHALVHLLHQRLVAKFDAAHSVVGGVLYRGAARQHGASQQGGRDCNLLVHGVIPSKAEVPDTSTMAAPINSLSVALLAARSFDGPSAGEGKWLYLKLILQTNAMPRFSKGYFVRTAVDRGQAADRKSVV